MANPSVKTLLLVETIAISKDPAIKAGSSFVQGDNYFVGPVVLVPGLVELPVPECEPPGVSARDPVPGLTRPLLQASVNSTSESLPSLLVSAELKLLTAD